MTSMSAAIASCADMRTRYWAAEADAASSRPERRRVNVWLDVAPGSIDGWSVLGGRRVRRALEPWNALALPIELAPAQSARDAEVTIEVIPHFPPDTRLRGDQYRAGLTHLTYDASGRIKRARIFIAQATPYGVRYSVVDQEATLLHELGHALGLPHADNPMAIMAAAPRAIALTPMDVHLARSVYRGAGCPRALLAAERPDAR
jgi:hypothetical protein